MEYKLISSTDAEYVAKTVNESLADGWELLGSVAVCVAPGESVILVIYVQAMTKKEVPAWVKRSRARMQARIAELSQADEHKSITAAGLPDTLDTLL